MRSLTNLDRTVDLFANRKLQPTTIKGLLNLGENVTEEIILKNAQFIRSELPTRLAKRVAELRMLPFILLTNPQLKKVDLVIR